MLIKVIAKGKGHGLGYNSYPTEVVFTMNVENDFDPQAEDNNDIERINERAVSELKRKTACSHVTVSEILMDEA